MPRAARFLTDGGIYHILNRGHNKQAIFHESKDYYVFKKYIKKYLHNFKLSIYHYVIMPNHFHLLLKTEKAAHLSQFMKVLCQAYAQYHNSSYKTAGCLFQNRYKCIFIKDERQLIECARYIERNPKRANMINDLSDYTFSSYNFYAYNSYDGITTINPAYLELGKTEPKRKKMYAEYVNTERAYDIILDKKLQIPR